jgi:hypothetical protein
LKAKYFPNGRLLDTVFTAEASPAWRGTENGLELLKQGIIWRVGEGKNIDIQRSNWIPRRSPMIVKDVKKHTRCRKVKDLFIQGTKQWNQVNIREMFYDYDANEILSLTPMAHDGDTPAWHYENNGIFSVKSAYKLAFNLQRNVALVENGSYVRSLQEH